MGVTMVEYELVLIDTIEKYEQYENHILTINENFYEEVVPHVPAYLMETAYAGFKPRSPYENKMFFIRFLKDQYGDIYLIIDKETKEVAGKVSFYENKARKMIETHMIYAYPQWRNKKGQNLQVFLLIAQEVKKRGYKTICCQSFLSNPLSEGAFRKIPCDILSHNIYFEVPNDI